MECPVCKRKKHLALDTHADGYAENLIECGDCGALWITEMLHIEHQVVIENSAGRSTH